MAYVYKHSRLDTKEVFYIGIGSSENYKRAYSKDSRNKFWHSIVNKCGYAVDILLTDLNWEEACDIEKYLISSIGRRDLGNGVLVNMTDGGDGVFGFKFNEESIKKMSNSQIGRKHSDDTKSKISKSQIGRVFSIESKLRMKEAQKGLNARGVNSKAKLVLDLQTGVYYECLVDATEAKLIKYSKAIDSLRGKSKINYNLIYA